MRSSLRTRTELEPQGSLWRWNGAVGPSPSQNTQQTLNPTNKEQKCSSRTRSKVPFPDLHAQFRTPRALTIMASNIGEILDIESPDSYIKRPTGPMITVGVRDISKLAGIIKIPSMAEGARPRNTTAQRILYSGLPNQCKRCQKFGHLAKSCPFNKLPTQEGGIPAKTPPISLERQRRRGMLALSAGT